MCHTSLVKALLGRSIAAACGACGSDGRLAESGSATGMNVLIVTIDTLRADRLGCYGHTGARTPKIDSLAGSGLLLEQATTV